MDACDIRRSSLSHVTGHSLRLRVVFGGILPLGLPCSYVTNFIVA